MLPTAKLRAALSKPFVPILSFFGGVAYDTLTLTRIDRLLDNLILLLYLAVLGLLIVFIGRFGREPRDWTGLMVAGRWDAGPLLTKAQPFLPMVMQFLLGGLFSAYAIFYSKSASLTGTAVFFGVLVALLVANEFLRDHLSNVRLLVALYAVVTFAFFTFFLPVMTGVLHPVMFVLGAILSGLVTLRVVELIFRGNPARTKVDALLTSLPAMGLVGVLVWFYFLNWIPPVPLSMKFGGIYHHVVKTRDIYELSFHKQWHQFWKRSDTVYRADQQVFFFAAVFAPVDLNTTIYHHWQYRPFNAKPGRPYWSADKLPIKVSGGREGGYRAYTVKQGLDAGEWRVDVETEDGRVLGRVTFRVERELAESPELKTIKY